MEARHNKWFSQIIEMLTHCNDVIAFSPSTIIYHASFHSWTKRADGILLHTVFCSFNDCIGFDPVWNTKWFHIWNKRLWLVFIHHWINSHPTYFKLDRRNRLEVLEYMHHGKWILASTDCNKYFISFLNHFEISNCRSNLSFDIIWYIQ